MSKIITLFMLLLLSNVLLVFADDPDLTLYGNEPQFANNIVLTIDDTSIESNTRIMFELLQSQGLSATFFPNLRHMKQQDPQLWQDIVAAGFEVGYHTINHTPYMTPDELMLDFQVFQDELRLILNRPSYTISYVRPPNGAWDTHWMTWANANHLYTVRWNITSMTDDLGYIDGVLQNRIHGGSIILLHTGYNDGLWLQNNLPALRDLQVNPQNTYQITSLSHAFTD